MLMLPLDSINIFNTISMPKKIIKHQLFEMCCTFQMYSQIHPKNN